MLSCTACIYHLQPAGRVWRWIAAPLAGLQYPEAEWVHVRRHRHLRFLERHGVLFEDNKGDTLPAGRSGGHEPPCALLWQHLHETHAIDLPGGIIAACSFALGSQSSQPPTDWRQHPTRWLGCLLQGRCGTTAWSRPALQGRRRPRRPPGPRPTSRWTQSGFFCPARCTMSMAV
jgi:hypothetical protein